MKKLIFYFSLILILNTSCTDINSKVDKSETIESTNKIIGKDLSGELFYLGDTTSFKIDSSILYGVTRVFSEVHNEGLFDVITVSSVLFAKNNLIKINSTNDERKGFYVNNKFGNLIYNSIKVNESFSSVLKYSIKGDTLLLPATDVFNYTDITPSKYKIKIQGDSLVYLTLILNSDELKLRRESIRRKLNIYYQYYFNEYTFDNILDSLTSSTSTHIFLKLKYE